MPPGACRLPCRFRRRNALPLAALVSRYGLAAIFAGAGIEGEAVLVAGGVLAQQGMLPLWGVAAAGAAGSCLVDQLWYWLGRHGRKSRQVQRIARRPAFARAQDWLTRYPTGFVLGFRFVYGVRTVAPIAIGAAGIGPRRFVPLNIISAIVWAPLISGLGYAFGRSLDPLLREAKWAVLALVAALVLTGAVIWLIGRRRT